MPKITPKTAEERPFRETFRAKASKNTTTKPMINPKVVDKTIFVPPKLNAAPTQRKIKKTLKINKLFI
jgi:hypothetical protein